MMLVQVTGVVMILVVHMALQYGPGMDNLVLCRLALMHSKA